MVIVIGTMAAILFIVWSGRRSYKADMLATRRARAALPRASAPTAPIVADDALRADQTSDRRTDLPFS
jgi:hypothetical protein